MFQINLLLGVCLLLEKLLENLRLSFKNNIVLSSIVQIRNRCVNR